MYLITDIGELSSHSMTVFCSQNWITHLFTTPYTSAHNGHAERLHCTLHEKARMMRIACNAPLSMWDEFCATAAFLINLSTSSSLHGRTPYECWFNRLPSLSHLRKNGCRAYALIHSHNPKLNPQSIPCIMIGYGRDTKVYRLWDPSTNRIFNSFHITFVEHLDSLPSPLSPNTTLGTDSVDALGSWDTPTIPSHSDPPPSPTPPTPPSPLIAPQSNPVHYHAPLSISLSNNCQPQTTPTKTPTLSLHQTTIPSLQTTLTPILSPIQTTILSLPTIELLTIPICHPITPIIIMLIPQTTNPKPPLTIPPHHL